MVAHVLRLRLALLFGALRGDRRNVIRTIFATVVFAAAVGAAIYFVLRLQDESSAVANALIVTTGAALLVGAILGPIIGGVEDQLDPRKFAVFGVSETSLAFSLLAAALISLPSFAVIAGSVAIALVWIAHGVSTGVAILAAVLATLTVIVASRVSMLVAGLWRVHRSRELTALFILGLVILVVPVVIFVGSLQWGGVVPTAFQAAAEALAFTPLGAVWAFPLAAESSTIGIIAIAVLTLALLIWAWVALVRHALNAVDKPVATREKLGMGWFAVLPQTQTGAVASRSLVYWLRDRRYIVNVAIIPFAAVAAALPLLIANVPLGVVLLLPVPIMALFFGWMPHNDIAYDSTAIWMHVVSGVRGLADRLGRLVPIFLIAVPILAIAIPVAVALYGRWAILPAVVGVAANLFLAGLGLSSISSVLAPYAVTRPGDSPFQQPQRTGSGVGSQAIVLLGTIAASIPTLLLGWDVINGDIGRADETLWLGVGIGAGVFIVGVAIGAILFDYRGAKLMEFAEAS